MSHILTLVASDKSPELTEKHFANAINLCNQHDLQTTDEYITWLDDGKAAQIRVSDDAPMELVEQLRETFEDDKIDFFILDETFKPKLLVADMESTIIRNEMLDDLGEFLGIGKQIKAITDRAMNGEIDFYQSVRERINLLKGVETKVLDEKRDALKPNPGAKTFVETLKSNGASCVLATGGFTYFSEYIAELCGFDEHHANELGIDNKRLTGKVVDPIFGPEGKLEVMQEKAKELGITPEQCITIGDGANDLPMLEKAGLGIGYHPKPAVKEKVKNCILHGDFTATLYALGYTSDMFAKPVISTTQETPEIVPV